MSAEKGKTVVCSWNEWDPLKHVIVGRADGTMVQAPEPAVDRDWPEYGFPRGTFGRLPREMEEKANAQLDNFARILEKRGIRVDRPTPIDFSQAVQTPDWKQQSMFGCMPPRDVLLTVGKEILEATMSYRSRWFEYLVYRPLLERYFKEDPGFRWEAAPKPRLTEATYKKDYWKIFEAMSEEEKLERTMARDWVLTEAEPCFDAADIARCGKDLIVQQSGVTNAAGVDWLRRHFPDHRVHAVIFKEDQPMHIDATFVPLQTRARPLQPPAQAADPRDGGALQEKRLADRRVRPARPREKGQAVVLQRVAVDEHPHPRPQDGLRGRGRGRADGAVRQAGLRGGAGAPVGRRGLRRRPALRHGRRVPRRDAWKTISPSRFRASRAGSRTERPDPRARSPMAAA